MIEEFTNYMVLIISNFWKKCLKRAVEANVQKRSPFLEHPVYVEPESAIYLDAYFLFYLDF